MDVHVSVVFMLNPWVCRLCKKKVPTRAVTLYSCEGILCWHDEEIHNSSPILAYFSIPWIFHVLTTDGQVSEEEPAWNEGLLGGTGRFAHDVQIRGVEAQSGGGQTISDQVHPQQLYWNQSLGKTESSSEEDTKECEEKKKSSLVT